MLNHHRSNGVLLGPFVTGGILTCLLQIGGCSPAQNQPVVSNVGSRSSLAGPDVGQSGDRNHWIQFPLPSASPEPINIAVGPDGNVWFDEANANKIGRITLDGTVTEFSVPTPASDPLFIVAGPDGNMWFTEVFGNKIGRITMAGVITEFPLPTGDADPLGITNGPDGALWFAEQIAHQVGRITTDGVITEFPAGGEPLDIARGADGNLWFTDDTSDDISSITTGGVVRHYPTSSSTWYMTSASDGDIWFTEPAVSKIGRVTPLGVVTEYGIPGGSVSRVSQGPGGWIWVSAPMRGSSQFVRFDPFGLKVENTLVLPKAFQDPRQSTPGPDGNMWFADGDHIGAYVLQLMVVQPEDLSFSTLGQTQNVVVKERKYSGGFTAQSSNLNVATVARSGPPGTFAVTSVGVGSCRITNSDTQQNIVSVGVKVH